MNQLARVGWCVCVWGIVLSVPLVAQELVIRSTPDLLQVSAPKLHFLTGKPLERLKSGNSVPFDFHLSLLTDNKQAVLRQSVERFL
ncbi:MAG TPA: hypothetical protein VEQ63_00960, partial [Bryobacteraceae bacterium]|nr:hypothetical protein [Bryobacteraceae bacterium]